MEENQDILETTQQQPKQAFNKTKFVKSTVFVLISNFILLISGLLTGFLVPGLLSTDQYAVFKIFSLYAGYVSILQFGLTSGVFLYYGSKNLEDISQTRFRLISRILILFQLVCSLITVAIGFIFFQGQYTFMCILLAVYLFSANIMSHFQQVSQITEQFKQYSIVLLMQSGLKLVACGLLWAVSIAKINSLISFEFYGSCYVGIFAIIAIYYLIAYRKYIFGHCDKFKDAKQEIFDLFKLGIPLLLADTAVVFVYSASNQIVSFFVQPTATADPSLYAYTLTDFAYLSFSYTVISLISTLVSSLSTVLYPTMKRANEEKLIANFSHYVSIMLIIGFLCLFVYFPVEYILNNYLVKYKDALLLLKLIFPGAVITSTINILIQNYYKTLKKNLLYFYISLGALATVIGTTLLFHYTTKNLAVISFATTVVYFLWFVAVQIYFVVKYKTKVIKNIIYAVLVAASFYASTLLIDNLALSLFTYLVFFILLSFFFYADDVFAIYRSTVEMIKNKREKKHDVTAMEKHLKNNETFAGHVHSQKKSLLTISVCFLVAIFTTSSAISMLGNDSSRACANVVAEQIKNSDDGYVYASVYSDYCAEGKDVNEEFRNFKTTVKGLSDEQFASSAKAIIAAKITDKIVPITYKYGDRSIESGVVSAYDATFKEDNYDNYGFKLMFDQEYAENSSDVDSTCVYVTEKLAESILDAQGLDITEENLKTLINASTDVDTKKTIDSNPLSSEFRILGIIADDSLGDLANLYGRSFTYCFFNGALYYYGVLSYDTIFYGNVSAMAAYISKIQKAHIASSGSRFTQYFYDHSGNDFVIGDLQAKIEATNNFYSSYGHIIAYVVLFVFALASVLTSFLLIKKEWKKGYVSFDLIYILLLFVSLLATIAIDQIIDFVLIGGVSVVFNGYAGITIAFIAITIISVLLIIHHSAHKNDVPKVVEKKEKFDDLVI